MNKIGGGIAELWTPVGGPRRLYGKFGLSLESQNFVRPNGDEPEEYTWFTKKPGFTICPVTTKGELILVRQYKQAARTLVTEFPAGVVKEGETPLESAQREFGEESGWKALSVIETTTAPVLLAPRKSPSYFQTFVALGCTSEGAQQLDEGEDVIEVYLASQAEVWEMIRRGEIQATETITAMLMAAMQGYISFPS